MMYKIITSFFLLLFLSASVYSQKSEVFIKNNKAIDGYDPVAFFTEHKSVKGFDSLNVYWHDATWNFSTSQNLASFTANPEKYAPQYGGYCAYGCSDGNGHKAPTQIDTWTIINDKLYFNYNLKVKEIWKKNTDSLINRANENWKTLKAN